MIFEEIETGARYSLADFGLDLQSGYDHPTPKTNDKLLYISGKHGAWDFGAELEPLPINLPVVLLEGSREFLQIKLREFNAFLFDEFAQPRTFKFFFDYEMDKFYYARYSGQIRPNRFAGLGSFTLPLTAFDPFAKFVVPTDEIDWNAEIPFTADISLDSQYAFNVTEPQTLNIINDGDLAVRPNILINGTADSLTLVINGESFSFGSISSPIEVKGETFEVKVNGADSFSAMSGDKKKLWLMPGENEVAVSGSNLNINLTFRYHYQYV